MSRPLVVKTGRTLAAIRARRGDFEDWIAEGLGLDRGDVDVAEVDRGAALPEPDAPLAVVVTGSSALVTDRDEWSERAAAWLADAVAAGTPVLGICYGHQLLAHGLGGVVADNARGREIGTVALSLGLEAYSDPLLGVLRDSELVHTTHVQSVVRLPEGARHLAWSPGDPNQAFAFGARAWGVQFHPEFDADVIRGYLEGRRARIEAEGIPVEALLGAVREAPAGPRLLRRFAELW